MKDTCFFDANEELEEALRNDFSEQTPEKTSRGYGYAALSALFSLFAVLGLLLCPFPSPAGNILAGRSAIFGGSLLGVLVEIARGSIFVTAEAPAIAPALCSAMIVLAAAVAASLCLTAIALFSCKTARPLSKINGAIVLVAYLAVAFFCYLGGEPNELSALTADIFDFPALGTALLCAAALTAAAMAENRGRGSGNFFLLILSALGVFACFSPAGALREAVRSLLTKEFSGERGAAVCLAALTALLLFNLLFSALRLSLCGAYGADTVRFGLQTIALASYLAVRVASDGDFDVFTEAILPLSLLSAASLCALFLSALLSVRAFMRKKRKHTAEAGEKIREAPPSRAAEIAKEIADAQQKQRDGGATDGSQQKTQT